jgi:processive 1,2-diacylglycerol beta-glucosyltransferase
MSKEVKAVLQHPKNILLVSASIGAGHTQAARAIQAAWNSTFSGDSVIIADFMDEQNSYLNYMIKETYLKMIEVTPFLYDALYHLSQGFRPATRRQSLFSWPLKKAMQNLLATYRPDLVICTHPFPCAAMAYLKRHRRTSIPLAGIITDFTVHSTWIYPEVDLYAVAAAELKDDLLSYKIPSDRVAVTGIPIQPPLAPETQANFREIGLQHAGDKPIVLVMGGGLGIGPLQEVVLALDSVSIPLQIVAVTGNNLELARELSLAIKSLRHSTVVLGYTPFVRELMRSASLLITKPGALTLSEAMAAGLPMLFYESFPGQETDNASFLISRGAADWFRPDQPEKIAGLIIDSVERKQILSAIGRIAQPDSAKAAVAAIAERLLTANQASGM